MNSVYVKYLNVTYVFFLVNEIKRDIGIEFIANSFSSIKLYQEMKNDKSNKEGSFFIEC